MIDVEGFYRQSCEAGFVKLADIARNVAWTADTAWGELEITINLSKPEKDPRDIAAAGARGLAARTHTPPAGDGASGPDPRVEASRRADASAADGRAPAARADDAAEPYVDPATGRRRPCPLCVVQADVECGYARRLEVRGEPWGLWYSPYAYYGEHCIAMSWEHRPMHIDRATFESLFDLVDALPQYFFGSNADLPIVGGSILSHDHFQGGRHEFPMQKAPLVEAFALPGFPQVGAGVVKWPLSVIRLESADRAALVEAACRVLDVWVRYDDPEVGIVSGVDRIDETLAVGKVAAATDGEVAGDVAAAGGAEGGGKTVEWAGSGFAQDVAARAAAVPKVHNTITPILRKTASGYQLDLALRCNITSPEHPLGVFHPHEGLHHIKKENIGLIEVMGLAILPPRVRQVMEDRSLSRADVGNLFAQVLECAGVFKWDAPGRAALSRFIEALGA